VSSDDLSERLVDAANAAHGVHAGYRALHARGVLCAARFVPDPDASRLTTAAHMQGDHVRAHVRFSNGAGNPNNPDTARDGRGMAVKFYLPDGTTTDVVGISLPAFFTRTPEDLLEFYEARADMEKMGPYLDAHPEALTAVAAAMNHPIPASYATLTYHALHAYEFEAVDGTTRFGRYHLEPDAGEESLDDDAIAARAHDYLATELAGRLGPRPVVFHLRVQIAEPGDPTDDPTAVWPPDRQVITAGRVIINSFADDRERDGDVLVFDPTRVTGGIRCSADPILLARAGAYNVSVARRTSV
jgi:catalase